MATVLKFKKFVEADLHFKPRAEGRQIFRGLVLNVEVHENKKARMNRRRNTGFLNRQGISWWPGMQRG